MEAIPLLWIIPALLIAVLLLALFWPVRLHVSGCLDNAPELRIHLHIRFFSGLISLKYALHIHFIEPARMVEFGREGKLPKVIWGPGRKSRPSRITWPVKQIWEAVRLKWLRVRGELGISSDACKTALLTGALAASLQSILLVLTVRKDQSDLAVNIAPAFHQSCLRLKLESIATAMPIHIMSVIFVYRLTNRKGKQAAWRILSKTS